MRLKHPEPVLLLVGALFRDEAPWRDALALLGGAFGPVAELSGAMPFEFTDYYEDEMGPDLVRRFAVFEDLIQRETLPRVKHTTMAVERRLMDAKGSRTVNLDPGYLSASSLVLATSKDYSHRIYLGEGVFGDVHLMFRRSAIDYLPWTYPDYRSAPYGRFFLEVRGKYLRRLKTLGCP